MDDRKFIDKTLAFDHQCADFGKPATERLRQTNIIWLESEGARGEKGTGATHTDLYFICDQRNAEYLTLLIEPLRETRGQGTDTAFSQNRFNKNSSNLFATFGQCERPVFGVLWIEKPDFRTPSLERLSIGVSHLNGTESLPMKCAANRPEHSATGLETGMFHRGFNGFRA